MLEQKTSIDARVNQSSTQSVRPASPCDRASKISSTASAEFSDTKVLNVATRSTAELSSQAAQRLAGFSDANVHKVLTLNWVSRQGLRAIPANVFVVPVRIGQAKLHQSDRLKSYRECEHDPCHGWM